MGKRVEKYRARGVVDGDLMLMLLWSETWRVEERVLQELGFGKLRATHVLLAQ